METSKVEMCKDIFYDLKCMNLCHFADTLQKSEIDHGIILEVIHLKEQKSAASFAIPEVWH